MRSFICVKCDKYISHGMGVNNMDCSQDEELERMCWGCWIDFRDGYKENEN